MNVIQRQPYGNLLSVIPPACYQMRQKCFSDFQWASETFIDFSKLTPAGLIFQDAKVWMVLWEIWNSDHQRMIRPFIFEINNLSFKYTNGKMNEEKMKCGHYFFKINFHKRSRLVYHILKSSAKLYFFIPMTINCRD